MKLKGGIVKRFGAVKAVLAFTDSVVPTLSSGVLSTSSVTASAFNVDFTKATDDTSAQSALVYKLYTSLSNNISSVANAEANGTLQDTQTDVVQLSASGLNDSTTYYFNVVVQDEAGNKTAYTSNSQLTLDATSPTVGTPTLSTSSVTETAFNVDFTKATDNISAQSALVYKLYTSASSNIGTVANAEANGTLQDTQTDVAQLSASGLTGSTLYYFNVVVEDEAGNKTAYTENSETTSAPAAAGITIEASFTQIAPGDTQNEIVNFTTPATAGTDKGIVVIASGFSGLGPGSAIDLGADFLFLTSRVTETVSNKKTIIWVEAWDWPTSTNFNLFQQYQGYACPSSITILLVSGLDTVSPVRETASSNGSSSDISTSVTATTQAGDLLIHGASYVDFRPNPPATVPAAYITTMDSVYFAEDDDNAGFGPLRYYTGALTAAGSDTIQAEDPDTTEGNQYTSAIVTLKPV